MTFHPSSRTARPWRIDAWLNTPTPLSLEGLRGRVVVLLAFQMLCPGCVAQALPLAMRVHRSFAQQDVAMIGLHTVFEHHDAMTQTALAAFLHEYRIGFPVGIDLADGPHPVPATMRAYSMRGTPTWMLYDTHGRLRGQWFGGIEPLRLGADIGALLERGHSAEDAQPPGATGPGAGVPALQSCDAAACSRDE